MILAKTNRYKWTYGIRNEYTPKQFEVLEAIMNTDVKRMKFTEVGFTCNLFQPLSKEPLGLFSEAVK